MHSRLMPLPALWSQRVASYLPRFFIFVLLAAPSWAEETAADQLKNLAAALKIPTWSLSTESSAALGYRDNVSLSSTQPERSGFLRGEVEAMLLRLPTQGWDGFAFFDIVETRYFSAETTDHERSAFLTTQLRWQPTTDFKMGLQAQGYHHDQVFDVSTTEISRDTALLKVTGITLTPNARWNFTESWWAEAQASGRQDHYAENLDGYTEGEGNFSLGWHNQAGTELSISGAERWRSHDSREQYTAAGRPLTGSRLKVHQNEIRLNLSLAPNKFKSWRGSLTALHIKNQDNGSGYFNFTQQQLTASLVWKKAAWECRGAASATRYDFPVQLVGIGITPENRHKEEYRLSLAITRRLNAAWALVGYYETERALSNDDRSRFRINTSYVGLSWSWDNLGLD